MELKPLFRFFEQCLFLSLILRSNILAQSNQQAGATTTESSSYFFYQRPEYPRDCKEIQQQCSAQNLSGAHLIQPDGLMEPFLVHCKDEWTVIQRRVDHFVDFTRDWKDYKDGFGFLNADFWIGNEKLAYLTNQKQYELMIDFETETGDSYHVTYNKFRISDEFNDYKLISVGEFTGKLGLLLARAPSDCYDLQQAGYTASGDYIVNPWGWFGGPFTINCNMDIDEGGWTVFQRRIDGTKSFYLGWDSYREGFGNPSGEFWMGNDKLAFLTNLKDYELRIDLTNVGGDWNSYSSEEEEEEVSQVEVGDSYYAKYDLFRITDESNNYRLVGLGNFNGTAAFDALRYHHNMAFSTVDRDNDVYFSYHCASYYRSAWWYRYCYHCDLNRPYTSSNRPYWYYLPGEDYLVYSEMKIRPVERTLMP